MKVNWPLAVGSLRACMELIRKTKWLGFRNWLKGYFEQDSRRRRQLIFRGHANAGWRLLTTLDRLHQFADDEVRKKFTERLVEEFRRELMHVDSAGTEELKGVAMELFARHQALPSPLMDWTESPYIAAFFAFANCTDRDINQAAIWMLDRTKLDNAPKLEIIDDYSLLRFNQRAIRQRGVFVRVGTGASLEDLVGEALTKILIPAHEFRAALDELDEMTINATYLFPDFEGAGRTAHFPVSSRGD